MARKTKRLFTIGYEQTPSKAVLDELESAGVKLLVDVRAVASSRRPGFSKNQLAAGLDERGISYLHLKGLGTPKTAARPHAAASSTCCTRSIGASEDTAGQGRTRRAVGAGEESRPGVHSLLRARPRPLPPAMDRRDHRGARWREGRRIWRRRRCRGRHCGRAREQSRSHAAKNKQLDSILRLRTSQGRDGDSTSPISRQRKRSLHHRHAAAADMRRNNRAILLCTRVSNRLGRPISTPCPIRSFSSPSAWRRDRRAIRRRPR